MPDRNRAELDISQLNPARLKFFYIRGTTYDKSITAVDSSSNPVVWPEAPVLEFKDGTIISSVLSQGDTVASFHANSSELLDVPQHAHVLLRDSVRAYASGFFTISDDFTAYTQDEIDGSSTELIINMTGPQGPQGIQGPAGVPGPPGIQSIHAVRHDNDNIVERPLAVAVYWIGSVEPLNAIDGDLWKQVI